MKNKSGFTIVELLIVIVVIAILAAVTVVAYNGINTRAQNARTISVAKQYLGILNAYNAQEGHYPISSDDPYGRTSACLTASGTLPADANFSENHCSTGDSERVIDSVLNTKLLSVSSALPSANLQTLEFENQGKSRSILYFMYSPGNYGYFDYFLKGDVKCPQGETWVVNSVTKCTVVLTN